MKRYSGIIVTGKRRWWLKKNSEGRKLWKEYAEGKRPWLGETPEEEAALLENRTKGEGHWLAVVS